MSKKQYVGDAKKFASSGVTPMTSSSSMNRISVADAAPNFFASLGLEDRIFMGNLLESEGANIVGAADDINNQALFFNRALELMTTQTYEVQYEQLPFRKLFPVSNEGEPGVKEIVSEVYDFFAKAQIISGGAKDVPFVAGGGKEISYPVIMWGLGASWTLQELQAYVVAQRNGRAHRGPEQIRQKAALRGVEEALNDHAIYGVPEVGNYGFLENPLVPLGVVDSGASGYTTWENKTADEILADINGTADSIFVGSKMIEPPDTLLLPPSKWSYIKNRRLDNREVSIMKYLLENSQYFKSEESIIPVNELEGAGYEGTGKMSVYRKDAEKLTVQILQEADAIPVQQNLFSYMQLWYAYSAGCIIRYPRSIAHVEGI